MTVSRKLGSAILTSGLLVAVAAVAADRHQSGSNYSSLAQIDTANVSNLTLAWEYKTGEAPQGKILNKLIAFEDQPSLIEGNLVVCTTSRRLIALDPQTGKERWVFDPKEPLVGTQKCRGISHWVDRQAPAGSTCSSRIFLGTAGYRLLAIDAKSGKPCSDFGSQGSVKMAPSEPEIFAGEVVATSKPAVVNDVVIVGSAVADNQRELAPSGRVLAFDARSGKQVWQFDPVPRSSDDPAFKTWESGTNGYGGGNVWATMSVDQALDLVYLPTTSPSGDFYGGGRPGDNRYTSGIVAVRGATGEVAWHFQFVHHNVFDYDTPSAPLLIDLPQADGTVVPALVQNNKTGLIFVFNRATGQPLVPIVERAVPQVGAVPGEKLSPTQPFPQGMPVLASQGFTPDDAWGFTFIDKWLCRRKVAALNHGPIFTPPSEKGTIFSPSPGGGPNWGGGAFDPASHIMVVASNRVPAVMTLIPRDKAELKATQEIETGGPMIFPNEGGKYVPKLEPLLSALGAPCSAPPWSVLTAVDLVERKIVWQAPLGSIEKMMPVKLPWEMDLEYGTPGAGGLLVTAGGLVFIGYTLDDMIRAFDVRTGKVLWKANLPAAGVGVPVTYEVGGEQYVVIPAGGHSMYGSTMGDSVMAYKLKR
ncbi:MAG TPA: pyrroloquinoline quinone-dependent dehydrogenase [Steroidobacter sp.]